MTRARSKGPTFQTIAIRLLKKLVSMTRSRSKGPTFWGGFYGFAWVALLLALFAFMLAGYADVWGVRGILGATALLPLSTVAYPVVAWYYTGAFPWLWTLGLVAAIGMGKVIMSD